MCISLAILFFILYEVGLTFLYKWVKKESADMVIWTILGSKVLKLIFAVAIKNQLTMEQLSKKMLIFAISFSNGRQHRGERLSFDPPVNLENST